MTRSESTPVNKNKLGLDIIKRQSRSEKCSGCVKYLDKQSFCLYYQIKFEIGYPWHVGKWRDVETKVNMALSPYFLSYKSSTDDKDCE